MKIIIIGFLDIRNTKIVNRAQAIIDSVKNVIFVLFYYFLTKRDSKHIDSICYFSLTRLPLMCVIVISRTAARGAFCRMSVSMS